MSILFTLLFFIFIIGFVVLVIRTMVRGFKNWDTAEQIEKKTLDIMDLHEQQMQEEKQQREQRQQQGNNISGQSSYCSNCGAKLIEGQNFCPVCGAPIAKTNGNKAQDIGYKTEVGGQNKEQARIYSSMDEVMEKAKNGDPIAQYFLADCYCNGRGIDCNKNAAASWMEKSAEQGYDVAQCELGLYYLNGTGVVQDDYEAVKWLTDAAWKGNAEAEYNLGLCYEQGRGVTFRDQGAADNWLSKAKQDGFDKYTPKKEVAKIVTKRTETAKTSETAGTAGATWKTKFCTNCGSPLNEGAKFCSNCGAPVVRN